MENNNKHMSKTRRIYFLRLIGRIIVLMFVSLLYIFDSKAFEVADGWNFFREFSVLHILWMLWMCDMVLQLIPVKSHISIGSQKVFESLFRPIKEKINYKNLKQYIKDTTKTAYKVMLLWIVLTAAISALYLGGMMDTGMMIVTSTFFYVCDLICVLIWCPFRLIMHNKCCTTCRIFNWDHLMMFLPIVALNSFFSWTLIGFAFVVWLIWELCVLIYPERFWENSNMALRCSECTDKLCTQYCRKLRK
ncbi:MAG: hypothetical protein II997_03665 [Clostridia bacterium]|nr:hypothetical protein [Clostridia bacterium]